MRRAIAAFLVLLTACLPALSEAARPAKPQAQGTAKRPYVVTADEIRFDQDRGLVVATGHVEISQGKEILLADAVTYNQHTDTMTASGHVSLLEPNGNVVFADFLELHDDFKDGFVRNIRMLLSDRSRLAGNTARRMNGTVTEIRRGVYSPCDLCKSDPTRAPEWQIRAERVVHNKATKMLEFHDAEMDFDGVPVMWVPYLTTPDPSVKRASGFLPPILGVNNLVGGHAEIPYFWVISPDKDMTIAPLVTTSAGVVLIDQYRERFANGMIDLTGSGGFGTPQVGINSQGQTVATNGIRGHLFGNGEFDLDNNWRATFNLQRASDQTYLLRYSFPSPHDFLSSYATLENFGRDSYANVTAMTFQSLWPGVDDNTQAFAAPLGNYMWVTRPGAVGGQLTLAGSGVDLLRISGTSERRLSLGAAWRRPFDGLIGDRFDFQASVRGDGYYSTGIPDANASSGTLDHAYAGRIFPQAALTWRYPWVRRRNDYTELIEPVVMGVVGPNSGNYTRIPNEDSQAFVFNDTDLFVPNRFPGFDLVDTGQRVDYGLRGGIYSDRGGAARFLVGQSYAFQTNTEFAPGSGLSTRLSDVVGRVTLTPFDQLNLIYRFRLGQQKLDLRSQEVAAQVGSPRFNLRVSYLQLASVANYTELVARQEITAALSVGLSSHWSTDLQEVRDFQNNVNLGSGVGLTYRDECFSFTASVAQSGISIGDVKPGVSVLFSFVFKNLGEFGLNVASFQY